jgi:hypothetical protein
LINAAAAGIYNVAYRVIFLLTFAPHFAATAIFPQASRLYATSHSEFKALYHNSLNLIILLGLPIYYGQVREGLREQNYTDNNLHANKRKTKNTSSSKLPHQHCFFL